jgi:integrase
MIRGYEHPEYGPQQALCRGAINQRMSRVKRCFKWGVAEELIPGATFHALQAVDGPRHGRSDARETEPIKPVPIAHVEATIAQAPPVVADMIRLQLLTGMRSGDLIIMRGINLETSGQVWVYKPSSHKTHHHGHSRVIAIGPLGQAIIKKYLKHDLQAFLFSPQESEKVRYINVRAKRKPFVPFSRFAMRKQPCDTRLNEKYSVYSYRRAVTRAAIHAGVPSWHPHQLRHTAATEIRKEFGIDGARAVLSHRAAAITEVYAELDQGQAIKIMGKIG